MSSVLSEPYFHDEAAAFLALERIVWPNGQHCPHCGATDRLNRLPVQRTKPSKKNPEGRPVHGLWKCYHCRGQFTVRKGTIFEDSHVELHIWFQAAHLMCSSKKGISSNQLHRVLGVTLKTAWFMSHRLRAAMDDGMLPPLGGDGSAVEIDETYVGGKWKNKHASKRGDKGQGPTRGKAPIFGLVERNGRARAYHVLEVSGANLRAIVRSNIVRGSKIYSDENHTTQYAARGYPGESVRHKDGEYVKGDAHTNTVEGYFAILKRGIIGTYHHVSEQHLARYLAEFSFRYSERQALGVHDRERATKALRGIVGKRLTYRGTDSGRTAAQAN